MIRIKLCRQNDGGYFQMVTEQEIDASGEWLPTKAQSFQSVNELKVALQAIVATNDGIIVKASNHFDRLAQELGLSVLNTEWGRL